MATRVTFTGITFNDSTILASKFGIIPQNSVTFFYQASAPTRWTKSLTHNDKTLRVVSGTGGGSGPASGGSAFTTVFPNSLKPISVTSIPVSGTVGDTTLTVAQLPSHSHLSNGSVTLNAVPALTNPDGAFTGWNGGDVSRSSGWDRTGPFSAGNGGGGGSHTHPWVGTASFSQNIDLRVQYVDVIACTFDG